MATQRATFRLPATYRAFFLLIEPLSAFFDALYCHPRQHQYLQLLHRPSVPVEIPPGTSVALSQLANMYLFFSLNEALVLRSTWDLRVWRTVLLVLLLADFGHLYAMKEPGPGIYYNSTGWDISGFANIAWVYIGAIMRLVSRRRRPEALKKGIRSTISHALINRPDTLGAELK